MSGMFNRERRDRELTEELESHLAFHVEDNLRAGMTPEEARRDALLKLGGLESVKEQVRERRGVPVLEHLARDLRFGVRMLRKDPSFTAIAVLTLALGIGANTAIFSVVNAVLLRPLPFPQAENLVLVWATSPERANDVASYPDFEEWKARGRSFESMAAFTTRSVILEGGDQSESVAGLQVTPGFLETLRIQPALGRTFRPEEAEAGASHVALLSDGAWKSRFAGRARTSWDRRSVRMRTRSPSSASCRRDSSFLRTEWSRSTRRWPAIPAGITVSCACWPVCVRASH